MILRRKIFKAIRTFFYSVFVFIFISPIFIMLNTSLKKYEDITKWPPTWFKAPLEWVNYKTG